MSEAAQRIVHYSVRDGIAVITLNNPPVNSLGNALRAAIMEYLKKAEGDPAVKGAVLIGSAKAFSGGADIREFNKPREKPDLAELNDQQDAMTKPLVAAIGGFALGGGLELALACHFRIALPKSQLGLPEVKLGLLPGSGGTQRLPRIIAMAEALRMMTSGNPIAAERAKLLGLVDEIVEGDLLEAAVLFLHRLLKEGRPRRRIRDMQPKIDGDPKPFLAQAHEQVAREGKGRLKHEEMDRRMSLITPSLKLEDMSDADIIVEAVFERMDVKQDLFKKLEVTAKPGAILATNTSTLDVDLIAEATQRPQDVIGTHFFSPANVMRLLEVVRGKQTGKDVLATTLKLGKTLKKLPVVSGVCDGFIGNRMLEKYVQQSLFLLDEGATPAQVDAALQKWGLAMGPFAMYDMAGNDIGWEIRKRRAKERPEMVYSKFADRICELGWFGQKTGKGFYRYEAGNRKPIPDPEVETLLQS